MSSGSEANLFVSAYLLLRDERMLRMLMAKTAKWMMMTKMMMMIH